ncbi:MAG TPA: VWA domain-containing protein [Thermoanaerobaculia bacterium]|nr:VWA domain-containing protein [Thermoanaerobaculia bacterium]
MKRILAALLLFALVAAAQEPAATKPITIALEPLGDTDTAVAARVSFRFAQPPEVEPGAELFLQGSFIQGGQVLRNFRFPITRESGVAINTVQSFPEGEIEIEVRIVMPLEDGAPVLVAKVAEKFTIAKTGKTYIASEEDGAEAVLAEGVVPETVGAVKIRAPHRDVAPNMFLIDVDVHPPVKRVEFWVEGKKVLARNAPPYNAELDLGTLPKRVEVRAVGYDAQGRYVDADAFIVNERDTPLELKITRTTTPDGVSHFKLSVQNPKGTAIKNVVLFAGDQKLQEWTRPPYAISIPTARLAGHEFVRASAFDATGYEASDLLFLTGERFIEELEVNLVELPVTVLDAGGIPIPNLTQSNFTLFENNKPHKISSFNYAADLPISVGVLLDHSGSMEKRMEDAKTAANEFFKSIMRKGDRAFIAPFASEASRNAPFVPDIATLEAQVNAIPSAAGGTSLHDAIVTGLYRFRNLQGRKALIVITDGDDTTSRLTYDDMLTYVRASRVPVYFIGIGFGIGPGMLGGPGKMRALAAESGAVAYMIRNTKQLPEAYKAIEQDLRSQYLLSYHTESTKKDRAYRAIEVKVDRPDAKVRTIRGFIP